MTIFCRHRKHSNIRHQWRLKGWNATTKLQHKLWWNISHCELLNCIERLRWIEDAQSPTVYFIISWRAIHSINFIIVSSLVIFKTLSKHVMCDLTCLSKKTGQHSRVPDRDAIPLVTHPYVFNWFYIAVVNVKAKNCSESLFSEVTGFETFQWPRRSFKYSFLSNMYDLERLLKYLQVKNTRQRTLQVCGNGKKYFCIRGQGEKLQVSVMKRQILLPSAMCPPQTQQRVSLLKLFVVCVALKLQNTDLSLGTWSQNWCNWLNDYKWVKMYIQYTDPRLRWQICHCALDTYHMTVLLDRKLDRNIEITVFRVLPEFNSLNTKTFRC